MYHHVFMYNGRDRNTNSQINSSTKYISNTYGGVMQNESYCNQIMINIYLEQVLEYLIDKKELEIYNYNY